MFRAVVIASIATLLCWRLISLTRNYTIARKVGIPIVVVFVDWQDPVWLVLSPLFTWIQWLPFGLGNWYNHTTMDGIVDNKFKVFSRLGEAYAVVSPNGVDVIIGDPVAAEEVIKDWKVWRRPQKLYDLFNTMGKGLASSDGEDWSRHRKIVSHGFKESTNKVAWETARDQTRQWLSSEPQETTLEELGEATARISINVLMNAIFGQKSDFDDQRLSKAPPGYTRGFSEALQYMINGIMLDLVATMLSMPKWLKFGPLKELDIARNNLYRHFAERLDKKDGELIKTMVEANEAEKNGTSRKFLTDQEMFGNMFIINMAGFETTAFAMLFTLANLTQYPQYQDWARSDADTYEGVLTAIRIRATLYETVRCHSVGPSLTRYAEEARTLRIHGNDHTIPAGVWVSGSFAAVHHNPRKWGDDADQWKPDRWIEVINGEEHLKQDLLEHFVGWSSGPRVCPGRKFSQVEGITVISEVLAKYRLEAGPEMQKALQSSFWNVTPKFKKPKSVSVRFRKH